jgi:hypothetical protein
VREIAGRFGVDPGTVQRISRPFEVERASAAAAYQLKTAGSGGQSWLVCPLIEVKRPSRLQRGNSRI